MGTVGYNNGLEEQISAAPRLLHGSRSRPVVFSAAAALQVTDTILNKPDPLIKTGHLRVMLPVARVRRSCPFPELSQQPGLDLDCVPPRFGDLLANSRFHPLEVSLQFCVQVNGLPCL